MKKIINVSILLVILFLVACNTVNEVNKVSDKQKDTVKPDTKPKDTVHTSGLKKFSGIDELAEYIKNSNSNNNYGYGGFSRNAMLAEGMAMDSVAMEKSEDVGVSQSVDSGASEFSTTNIQVEGVDEADIVKNDGKYIYMVNQDKLIIADAYPAEDAKVVYEEELKGRPMDLFINNNTLVVFMTDDSQVLSIEPYDYMPRPRYVQQTRVLTYDVSDRSNPELVDEYKITGNYFQSRMIGDYVYFIVKDNVYYYNNFVDMPSIRATSGLVVMPEIYYFDNPEDNYVFYTVASFKVDKTDSLSAKSYLMGYSNTLYVSQNNIYIAYQKNLPWRYYQDDKKDKFFDVVVPLLPSDIRSKIKQIDNSEDKDYAMWVKISEVLQKMYDSMSDREQENLVDKIADATEKYEVKKESELRKTVVHKLNINKGEIDYDTSGEFSGYLLNQFSLDEYGDYLRVATTTYTYSSKKSSMHNNVYVLDENLDIVGSLENIAPDEKIYSTRFIGDRLYMVTFKRIDPLFVIDLSNPKDPSILGKLKIPGYSDYLHPYDENHIIGIGKETGTNEWGGISTKGVKLSLFDVTDVSNPKQVDKYEIGDRGTDSEALRDHKAFLFDKKKNILVIPIREVREKSIYDKIRGYYQDRVWQGAYVFGLTPKDGFELKAKISHQSGLEKYYNYYSGNAVRRALYMDDVLYTVSGKKIKANDMDNWDEITTLTLPFDEDKRWYWY